MFQIRVDGILPPAQNALLYETVTVVEGKPILRDMVFSPDNQYIYLLSDKQVRSPDIMGLLLTDGSSNRVRPQTFGYLMVETKINYLV